MAWNVTLGMDEAERDYLLFQGRCKKCGHFNALHRMDDSDIVADCLVGECECLGEYTAL